MMGGEVLEEEADSCGKFVFRGIYRTIQEGKDLPILFSSHCYAVYGHTSKYNYQFVG